MKIEGGRGPLVGAAEFGVAAVADGDVPEPSVDDEIDQRGGAENPVRDEILAEPVEHAARQRADDDDREADFRIEVLADVEIAAAADRTAIYGAILAHAVADRNRSLRAAPAALDRRRR